jgi:nucleotide-binding universal stress UspA family protein
LIAARPSWATEQEDGTMSSIRKILASCDSAAARAVVETAFAVARPFAAHVEVLHIRPDPRDTVPLLGEGVSGSLIEELIQLAERETNARAATAKAVFEEICHARAMPLAETPAGGAPSARWLELTGRTDDLVVARGRLADLLVIGRTGSETEGAWALTLNAALFETGRPLLVPTAGPVSEFGRSVAIAWNASAESARSVSAAMPFLSRAQTVTVMTVSTDFTPTEAAGDLIDYLRWHGVTARIMNLAKETGAVGARLLAGCADSGADLLVLGAYTHSRIRELILGGVTRYVLAHAELPLLITH